MAYMCVRCSGRECDGCMECKGGKELPECGFCSDYIRGDIYLDEEYGEVCLKCLKKLHLKEERSF